MRGRDSGPPRRQLLAASECPVTTGAMVPARALSPHLPQVAFLSVDFGKMLNLDTLDTQQQVVSASVSAA